MHVKKMVNRRSMRRRNLIGFAHGWFNRAGKEEEGSVCVPTAESAVVHPLSKITLIIRAKKRRAERT